MMSDFPTVEQEALYSMWYKKESQLYRQIAILGEDIQSQNRVDFELTIIGLRLLLKGFHEQCVWILTERTDKILMLNGQIEKTYDFLTNLFEDLKRQWSQVSEK